MKDLFEEGANAFGAATRVEMEMSYRAMRIPEDASPVLMAKGAMERCGLTPKTRMITGGTDASIFNERGIQMAILGMGTKREHTVEEHIHVSDMEKVVEILKALFDELCE
jgi:tripeptide aminopeptidase